MLSRLHSVYYAGSHGMDIMAPVLPLTARNVKHQIRIDDKQGSGVLFQPAKEFLPIIQETIDELEGKTKCIHGVILENKRFCISVRFRRVREELVDGKFSQHMIRDGELGTGKARRVYSFTAAEDVAAAEEGRRELSSRRADRRRGAGSGRGEARRRGAAPLRWQEGRERGRREQRRWCTDRSSEEKEEVQGRRRRR
ncbi:hypothetical protein Syun_016830 [Stephania yunnanensis]|uniref:Uncharacterized protein n=1 Tax=Stephania yunnanensis TaxID=152371 RepID=A0AAP0P2I4_9MAGN